MRYSVGLDVGIASVGWAVLDLDRKRIKDLGVRAFTKAEIPDTGAPLAEPRRLARTTRRRLRRRAERLARAKGIFRDHRLVPAGGSDGYLTTSPGTPTPWELRVAALDRSLSGAELARALFHLTKRRGFKPARTAPKDGNDVKKKEDAKMLGGIKANEERAGAYRTAGEMFALDDRFADRKRNVSGSYIATVSRSMLENEIRAIFAAQRAFGNSLATEGLEADVLENFLWQKPFASGDKILKKVGPCVFEPDQKRAPRNAYSFELFNVLQNINHLTWDVNGVTCSPDADQRADLRNLAHSHNKLTFTQVRRALGLPEDARFTRVNYRLKLKPKKQPDGEVHTDDAALDPVAEAEKAVFAEMKGYHAIRKQAERDGVWDLLRDHREWMDAVAYAHTVYKSPDEVAQCLSESAPDMPPEVRAKCREWEPMRGHRHLSFKALANVLPHMELGMIYSDACAAAGYDHAKLGGASVRSRKLPPFDPDDIRNPVVLRALTQARKVINAIINRYGEQPYTVHIELAREVGKSREVRNEIDKRQKENERDRERLVEEFKECFGREPKGPELLKFRLYREQHGKCAYSLQPINLARLLEDHYTEIDHVLPYSRSFDDSRSNRVLVLWEQNQRKQNRTPYEFFGSETDRWGEFEAWVKATFRDPRKRERMLKRQFGPDQEKEWKERNLQDTKWATRVLAAHIRDHLEFCQGAPKQKVICLNGFIVSKTRQLWGLAKDREQDDLHHAQDAAVIASLLPHQVQLLTEHAQAKETGRQVVDAETGEVLEGRKARLPWPWPGFRWELEARLSDDPRQAIAALGLGTYDDLDPQPVMVSRMPSCKAGGPLHEETIRSTKKLATHQISAVLKRLSAKEDDPVLYRAIVERCAANGMDLKKAFSTPLFKPGKDGTPGVEVRRVRVHQTQTTGVRVRSGIADNGSMVRTDVFRKKGKHYLVPVYACQIASGILPNRAIVAHKPEAEWLEMDPTFEFVCALYPFDLVRINYKGEDQFWYYRSTHRGGGALELSSTNQSSFETSRGAQSLKVIERWEVGVLGDKHPVRGEKRPGVANRNRSQSCSPEG